MNLHWHIVLCLVAQLWPTICNPMDCSPPGSFFHGDSPGKNTGVGCHALLQGIFPTQGSNPNLPPCRCILYPLSHQGSPPWHIIITQSSEFRLTFTHGVVHSGGLDKCIVAATAAAKSLQSCPTLCDPIDGSPCIYYYRSMQNHFTALQVLCSPPAHCSLSSTPETTNPFYCFHTFADFTMSYSFQIGFFHLVTCI